jgi:hypothetical protein
VKEVEARDAWRRTYRKIYGELIALYAHEPAWAESFFRTPDTRKEVDATATEPNA